MLAFEGALARAAGDVGLVDAAAATVVADACAKAAQDVGAHLDLEALAAGTATQATPVVELVRQLKALVPADARHAVHVAATSQDVVDTAAMLVVRDCVGATYDGVAAVVEQLAGLALQHRATAMVGRTLLQHGEPTTFGALCAVRLVAVREALARASALTRQPPVQLGGAVGTLAAGGQARQALVERVADLLGLSVPLSSWHPTRGPVVEIAASLGILAGELAGVAQDVVLLSSTDIAEVSVAAPGGSSAMPHKQNPSRAVLALACAHRVPGLVATLLAGMPGELQRSAGRWQAEAPVLVDLLRLVDATAAHVRASLDGLVVHPDRMGAAVDALLARTGGTLDTSAAEAVVDRALGGPHEEDHA